MGRGNEKENHRHHRQRSFFSEPTAECGDMVSIEKADLGERTEAHLKFRRLAIFGYRSGIEQQYPRGLVRWNAYCL